jgi:trehalose/maltose transport system substrate-binding protein
MKFRFTAAALAAALIGVSVPSFAAEISISASSTGKNLDLFRKQLDAFEKATGNTVKIVTMPPSSTEQFSQYRLWLAAGNTDVDVYQTDVIWAPQLADQFVDLKDATKDVVGDFFPAIVASQTVNGRLVAIPLYTDAPALFYRKDLLEKYGKQPPKTWDELAATAKEIQDKERADGKGDMWGYAWQAKSYEGLTCDAIELIASNGGGTIISDDGKVTIDNPKAAEAIEKAKGWIGSISPEGTLNYDEEASRAVFESGNAVFHRQGRRHAAARRRGRPEVERLPRPDVLRRLQVQLQA